jgi:peptidoglycan/LPS O-acetylase OafA/YrhL
VFAVGVVSARRNWFDAFSKSSLAARMGWAGLIGGPVLLLVSMAPFPPVGNPPALVGGWNPAAFAMAFWEQLAGLALGAGCLAWFSRKFNKTSRFGTWLTDNSFGVYVFHAPVLVGLTMLFASLQAGPWPKMLLLTAAGLVVTYPLSAAVRSVPFFRKYL